MTIAELIERLKEFDPDCRVVVEGGMEVGFDDVSELSKLTLSDIHGQADGRGPYNTEAFAKKYDRRAWCPYFDSVFIGRCPPNTHE